MNDKTAILIAAVFITASSCINLWLNADPYMRETMRIFWSKYKQYFWIIVAALMFSFLIYPSVSA